MQVRPRSYRILHKMKKIVVTDASSSTQLQNIACNCGFVLKKKKNSFRFIHTDINPSTQIQIHPQRYEFVHKM